MSNLQLMYRPSNQDNSNYLGINVLAMPFLVDFKSHHTAIYPVAEQVLFYLEGKAGTYTPYTYAFNKYAQNGYNNSAFAGMFRFIMRVLEHRNYEQPSFRIEDDIKFLAEELVEAAVMDLWIREGQYQATATPDEQAYAVSLKDKAVNLFNVSANHGYYQNSYRLKLAEGEAYPLTPELMLNAQVPVTLYPTGAKNYINDGEFIKGQTAMDLFWANRHTEETAHALKNFKPIIPSKKEIPAHLIQIDMTVSKQEREALGDYWEQAEDQLEGALKMFMQNNPNIQPNPIKTSDVYALAQQIAMQGGNYIQQPMMPVAGAVAPQMAFPGAYPQMPMAPMGMVQQPIAMYGQSMAMQPMQMGVPQGMTPAQQQMLIQQQQAQGQLQNAQRPINPIQQQLLQNVPLQNTPPSQHRMQMQPNSVLARNAQAASMASAQVAPQQYVQPQTPVQQEYVQPQPPLVANMYMADGSVGQVPLVTGNLALAGSVKEESVGQRVITEQDLVAPNPYAKQRKRYQASREEYANNPTQKPVARTQVNESAGKSEDPYFMNGFKNYAGKGRKKSHRVQVNTDALNQALMQQSQSGMTEAEYEHQQWLARQQATQAAMQQPVVVPVVQQTIPQPLTVVPQVPVQVAQEQVAVPETQEKLVSKPVKHYAPFAMANAMLEGKQDEVKPIATSHLEMQNGEITQVIDSASDDFVATTGFDAGAKVKKWKRMWASDAVNFGLPDEMLDKPLASIMPTETLNALGIDANGQPITKAFVVDVDEDEMMEGVTYMETRFSYKGKRKVPVVREVVGICRMRNLTKEDTQPVPPTPSDKATAKPVQVIGPVTQETPATEVADIVNQTVVDGDEWAKVIATDNVAAPVGPANNPNWAQGNVPGGAFAIDYDPREDNGRSLIDVLMKEDYDDYAAPAPGSWYTPANQATTTPVVNQPTPDTEADIPEVLREGAPSKEDNAESVKEDKDEPTEVEKATDVVENTDDVVDTVVDVVDTKEEFDPFVDIDNTGFKFKGQVTEYNDHLALIVEDEEAYPERVPLYGYRPQWWDDNKYGVFTHYLKRVFDSYLVYTETDGYRQILVKRVEEIEVDENLHMLPVLLNHADSLSVEERKHRDEEVNERAKIEIETSEKLKQLQESEMLEYLQNKESLGTPVVAENFVLDTTIEGMLHDTHTRMLDAKRREGNKDKHVFTFPYYLMRDFIHVEDIRTPMKEVLKEIDDVDEFVEWYHKYAKVIPGIIKTYINSMFTAEINDVLKARLGANINVDNGIGDYDDLKDHLRMTKGDHYWEEIVKPLLDEWVAAFFIIPDDTITQAWFENAPEGELENPENYYAGEVNTVLPAGVLTVAVDYSAEELGLDTIHKGQVILIQEGDFSFLISALQKVYRATEDVYQYVYLVTNDGFSFRVSKNVYNQNAFALTSLNEL